MRNLRDKAGQHDTGRIFISATGYYASPDLTYFVRGRGSFVSRKKTAFDPKIFLAKVGDGKAISKYQKDQIVFSQGDVADAVFCIQKGRIKLTVVSERGKEAVV
jgi:CRP-like cAMP-binding protein